MINVLLYIFADAIRVYALIESHASRQSHTANLDAIHVYAWIESLPISNNTSNSLIQYMYMCGLRVSDHILFALQFGCNTCICVD